MKRVRIIFRKKDAILVQVSDEKGNLKRFVVPSVEIKLIPKEPNFAFVSEKAMERSIPYGIPWEYKLKDRIITSEELATSLRNNGLWTEEDIFKNPSLVQGALMSALKLSISEIIAIAKEYKEK